MSILYQALSRAARENARRSATEPATAEAQEPAAGAGARLRNFTTLSFRPRRSARDNRRGVILLGVAGAALAGLVLLVVSLPSDMVAEIPVVSDVAEMFGLAPEPFPYAAEPQPFDAGADAAGVAGLDDGALSSDEERMMTPPAALAEAAPEAGGGIEIVNPAPTADQLAAAARAVAAAAPAGTEPAVPEQETAEVAGLEGGQDDAPAAILPESQTDSLHPTDAPPAEARETLEQTLQRLANERGFTDLAPPVAIARAADSSTTDPAADAATQDDGAFSITIDDRAQVQQASFEAAYSSLLAGNTEGALNLYMDVLKDDPDNTFALFGLASTLQRIGWLAEARATYEELLAI